MQILGYCIFVRDCPHVLGSMGNETVVSHISQHGKTWPYWFKKMGWSNFNVKPFLRVGVLVKCIIIL